jgi:hypothetical protein
MTRSEGFGRLAKPAVIGGIIGGILSSIPILNCLNVCLCVLMQAGAGIGVSMYLRGTGERLSVEESFMMGALSGGVGGLIAGIVNLVLSALMQSILLTFLAGLGEIPPDLMAQTGGGMVGGVIGIPVGMVIYAVFGGLGSFLTLHFLFPEQKA